MKKFWIVLIVAAFWACAAIAGIKADEKIAVNENTWFKYAFVERPKVGDVIMKVVVSDQDKRNISVFAQYDMPSMRGHHASGKVAFKRNRTNDYVLPIHFAMPGDWEIVLTIEEDGAQIYQGTVQLDI